MAKAKKYISPAGEAVYPRLNIADTEYDADGVFSVRLRADVTDPAAAEFKAQIDTWHEESRTAQYDSLLAGDNKYKTAAAVQKVCKDGDRPYTFETDDDGEDTDIILFSFKMKNNVTARATGKHYTFVPTFIDSRGKVIAEADKPSIYGGSKLKVRFEANLWDTVKLGASVQLRMDAVQILELVTGGSGNSEGFGDEGEGYEAEEGSNQNAGFTNETDAKPEAAAGAAGGAGDTAGAEDGDF